MVTQRSFFKTPASGGRLARGFLLQKFLFQTGDEMPGLSELLKFRNLFPPVREQAHGLHVLKRTGRKHVPDVFRNDVGDEQINFVAAIRNALMRARPDVITATGLRADAVRRLQLNTQKAGRQRR